jgi:hypothetical protein
MMKRARSEADANKKTLHSHISAETRPAHHAPTRAAPALNPTGLRTRSTSTESKEDTC